ncbi:hypothetical protein Trco_006437 [Trichoderma cornu-damae]|uniref:Uncharacterized protein n=1 Tax=Trichoderma cornu-damae TaxID=654480 RepID=A0A9P8QF75_9HYPO|nr:hypothetical protein Trco_006437 [Trichoderma cornu-damae]
MPRTDADGFHGSNTRTPYFGIPHPRLALANCVCVRARAVRIDPRRGRGALPILMLCPWTE